MILEEAMLRLVMLAAVAATMLAPTGARADKSWCTDAHMQKML